MKGQGHSPHHLTLCITLMTTVRVQPITLSCIVGFENNLAQMTIMTRRNVANKGGAVVEWLEQVGYGAESRRIA